MIGFALDLWGRSISSETYQNIFATNYLEAKVLISSLFLHECWFFSVRPGSNGPFWSLSYEFLYYMIFGSIMLLPSLKSKLIGVLLWILIAGPKILLLFPRWLIGCLAYYGCKSSRINIFLATFFGCFENCLPALVSLRFFAEVAAYSFLVKLALALLFWT